MQLTPENAMDADVEMAKQFPYSEMAKFGWVPETRDAKEKVIYLRKYFEVVELSLLGNEQITRIACRRLVLIRLLFTPTPITPLIGVEPMTLWGQRDRHSLQATLLAPLTNKNFAKTGANCNPIRSSVSGKIRRLPPQE